jgi:hypothetical protein
MPNTFKLLPDEPILLQLLGDDFDYSVDMLRDLERLLNILDQLSQPVFYIIDVRQMSLTLDDLIAAAGTATQQAKVFKHPNIRETIIVTESRMIALSAKGLNSPIFGNIKFKVFGSVEEALDYARRNASLRSAV